jgi:hypothetical protein
MTVKIDHPLKIVDVVMEWCEKCGTYTPHLLQKELAGPCLHCPSSEQPAAAPKKVKVDQPTLF